MKKRIHLVVAAIWIISFWPGLTIWRDQIWFVIAVSLFANLYTAIAAAEAANKATNCCVHCPDGKEVKKPWHWHTVKRLLKPLSIKSE